MTDQAILRKQRNLALSAASRAAVELRTEDDDIRRIVERVVNGVGFAGAEEDLRFQLQISAPVAALAEALLAQRETIARLEERVADLEGNDEAA